MFVNILLLIVGFVILVFGAEILVRGASSIASRFGISPMVIGLTIVAFGTSAPELAVNMFSAFKGSSDIAIGNIIGSNIANILLILGISSIISPLTVKKNTVWKEIPLALLGVVLVFIMGNDFLFDGGGVNAISRTDGFSLIAIFIIFMVYIFSIAKSDKQDESIKTYNTWLASLMTVFGIGFLFFGGNVLVDNAVALASRAGMSEALIGLTIVAVGTSLPELATSVVAVIRGQNDIAIGNIVGSGIFNVFWILGLTSTILQLPFNSDTNFDVLVAIFATFLLFVSMFIGKKYILKRWQGILFVLFYAIYIIYLIYRG